MSNRFRLSPPLLMDLAKRCREVYDDAVAAIGPDLCGMSVLDLCADNIPRSSLQDLKSAIVVSGIAANANDRIRKQIAGYR